MITEQQRQRRRDFLGSSDMAILLACLLKFPLPYKKTDTDVYWSKVTDLPDSSTASTETGDWLEKPLLGLAAEELGVEIITEPERLFTVAQEGEGKGLLAAHHDSLIVGQRAGIEAKFRNADNATYFGEPYTDQVAMDVIIQVQAQMYCADLDKVYVVLGTPSYYTVEHRLYCVPRDEDIIEQIVHFGADWWRKHVEAKIPPNGETVPPLYVLKALERRAGAQIKLPDEAVAWADRRIELKEQIKALTSDVEQIDAKLIHALGEAEAGLLSDGRKVTYHRYESNRFDSKQLKIDEPDLAQKYMRKSHYRTLYIRKK